MLNEYAVVASMIFNSIINIDIISSLYYEYNGIDINEFYSEKIKS